MAKVGSKEMNMGADSASKNLAIDARGVTLTYPDGTQAIKKLDLQIRPSELVFLTGESGSGKTSAISLLVGAVKPSTGSLCVLGEEVPRLGRNALTRYRQRLGIVFQNLRLVDHQSAIENTVLPLRFGKNKGRRRERGEEALSKVGLVGLEDKKVSLLSGGERQRVAIARAIVGGAELIIADEPTGNLDHENAVAIMHIFKRLAEEGAAVIVTTHAVSLLPQLAPYRQIKIVSGVFEEVAHE